MEFKQPLKIIFGSILLLTGFSCKKFVEISAPKNQIVTSTVFSDSADATSAILGVYINIMAYSTSPTLLSGNISLYNGLAADELYPTTGSTDDLGFYTNGVSSHGVVGSLWTSAYNYIYQANACIEGLSGSKSISTTAKNQLLGEAKIIRALCYFHLVNIFGRIPLVTTTDFKISASLPQVPSDSVYMQIESDLVDAESLLPAKYISTDRLRPNQYTAASLLARVYLYRKEWGNAEKQASKVIGSGIYTLETDVNNVFVVGNNEAIWQLPPLQQGYETAEGVLFVPTDPTVIPSYVVSNYLLNAFESNDNRFKNWLDSTVVDGSTYYYPYKYKLGYDNNSSPAEYYSMFRLAELYLIRAEAEAEGAGAGLNGSIADINIIRNRAGLPSTAASDQPSLITAVEQERRIELFCEWGHRWYDLRRTGKLDGIMGAPGDICAAKGGIWNSNWQISPIPFQEIQTNPAITQNQGYQ